jgi:hypothetical protein
MDLSCDALTSIWLTAGVGSDRKATQPQFVECEAKTDREIPVVVFTRCRGLPGGFDVRETCWLR